MLSTYTCSPVEFLQHAKLPVRIMESEEAMYEEISDLMLQTIIEKDGERCVIICPVGPVNQYKLLADKINKNKVSLKNVWFINMDEYLTDEDQYISYDNPLNFHAIMDKLFYSQVNTELLMPTEQRLFPIPGREKEIDELLENFGYADITLTGVGINGHIAFNEAAENDDLISNEEFKKLPTRILNISRETITNNGGRKLYGALDLFPRRCITLGMEQILKTKKIKIYLYCDWQWGPMRKLALEKPSKSCPASFLQSHQDAEMVITRKLYDCEINF